MSYGHLPQNLLFLGKICNEIWPKGTIPEDIARIVMTKPASSIAVIMKHKDATAADQAKLNELIGKVTLDIANPSIAVEWQQLIFWRQNYDFISTMDKIKKYGPNELMSAGISLFGIRWQTNLAKALGLSDARRIRQWMSKDRPIPNGVWADIAGLLKIHKMEINKVLDDLTQD